MKAIVQDTYGLPDVLRLEDIDRPVADEMRCWFASAQRPSTSATGTC